VIDLFLMLYVLGAIVAVGFSLSYGLWLARGDVAGVGERVFALRTISWIDRRLTTPAYALHLAVVGFAPAHRQQTALAEQLANGEGVEEEYRQVASRARIWGVAVTALTLVIVVLMVTKPNW